MREDPKITQREYDRKIDAMKVCGTNRGPHDYIPIAWVKQDDNREVTVLMCRVCFCRIRTETLLDQFEEIKF